MSDIESYDSAADTRVHIAHVRRYLGQITRELMYRAKVHDRSKFSEAEKATFDRVTPRLAELTFRSAEYTAALKDMGPALDHHYAHNDHHPQHFLGGIEDMDLVQITEMLADWKAASLRHHDGSMRKSLIEQKERFGYGPELDRLLWNTAQRLGWLDDEGTTTA